MFQEDGQELEWLLGKPDAEPPLAQFSSTQVRFVNAKRTTCGPGEGEVAIVKSLWRDALADSTISYAVSVACTSGPVIPASKPNLQKFLPANSNFHPRFGRQPLSPLRNKAQVHDMRSYYHGNELS